MNLERFCLKFFSKAASTVDEAIFIDIFHEWIRHKKLGGILLDVADYRHVPNGPGIMLITHEINFAMDHEDGRFGLFAQRKQGSASTLAEAVIELARATITFGALLEADARLAGRLQLEAGQFQFMANDRRLAPNTTAAFAAIQPDLSQAANAIYPAQTIAISQLNNDSRDRLTAIVDSGVSFSMGQLVEAVGVAA